MIRCSCEYYALEGFPPGADLNKVPVTDPGAGIEGLLRTMYIPASLATAGLSPVARAFGAKVYRTVIHRNVRLAEALAWACPRSSSTTFARAPWYLTRRRVRTRGPG